MRDAVEIQCKDLPHGSNANVVVKCDYCGVVYNIAWHKYVNNHKNGSLKDACFNCKWIKGRETMLTRYGTNKILEIPGVAEKQASTNKQRYGCANPFANEDIKQKIMDTNIKKYGVAYYTQTEEYLKKKRATSLQKYGVEEWMRLDSYRTMFRGEKSPRWKPDKTNRDRYTVEYRDWRTAVFQRDRFTCQICNCVGGYLEAHHLYSWNQNKSHRYDVDNGITLCRCCHLNFHKQYGFGNNTPEQFSEYRAMTKRYAELQGTQPVDLRDKKPVG